MRNVTNYFLVNLSLADLVMSCLNTIFNFAYMKNRYNILEPVFAFIFLVFAGVRTFQRSRKNQFSPKRDFLI